MWLTIELPNCDTIKIEILDSTTLKEICQIVNVDTKNAVFFCDRWNDELGTLMTSSEHELYHPITRFNTQNIAIVDRTKILNKDIIRFNKAILQGY